MKPYRTVIMDPTGNITCLVTDPVPEEERPAVTAALMDRCEQVGYLEKASNPAARIRLRMMGGEFCGNAAMSTAAYLAEQDGLAVGKTAEIPLEVSGAGGTVFCRVERLEEGFRGTVAMPGVRRVERRADGITAVEMEGITHLIRRGTELPREEAEALLLREAEQSGAEALGLLQWDPQRRFMRPLVRVRDAGTLVWENGCGSGTCAIGAAEALKRGDGATVTEVLQPGGRAEARVTVLNGRVTQVFLTGIVKRVPSQKER